MSLLVWSFIFDSHASMIMIFNCLEAIVLHQYIAKLMMIFPIDAKDDI